MPTTITSAGITFNDATSLTSANIGTAQLVNGSVTAAKLGTNEQKQIAKAWVNFNGVAAPSFTASSGTSLSVTIGSATGTWSGEAGWSSSALGVIYFINIGGSNATLGGVNVSTVGVRITNIVSSTVVNFTLLAGPAISTQTVNGNGAASGFTLSTSGIRSSYNVSSVTKNGTGDYTVNFATPMADANYSVSFGCGITQGSAGFNSLSAGCIREGNPLSTASFRMTNNFANGSITDGATITATIFGN